MQAFWNFTLPILLFVTSVFLILLVLIQRGRGGGLAGAFGGLGGQSAFGTKAGDLFTRITIGTAAFWIILCAFSVKQLGDVGQSRLDARMGPEQTAPSGAASGSLPPSTPGASGTAPSATPGKEATGPALPGTSAAPESSTPAATPGAATEAAPAATPPATSAPAATPPAAETPAATPPASESKGDSK